MDAEVQNNDPLSKLFEMLSAPREAQAEALRPENLRYAMYARKSTIDEGRQEKSISDQVADCYDRVIKPSGIVLDDSAVIEEKGSAKEPDIRPKFRKLLNDIYAGKYDGIISWHPDRLARNMKEAGEIIDMLDKGIIKDLRFATSTFENSPTGKMLLGISFVLSKQYSEHLSEMVTRGNRRKTESGKFLGKQKHGYFITDDGRLTPDGENFSIIKQAFEMRMGGESQAEIAKYLNKRSDYRIWRRNREKVSYKWDKDSVSKLLRDPIYAGILMYGETPVNLIEAYDFEPVITADEFLSINHAKDFLSPTFKSAKATPRTGARANLLRGLVYCSHCGKTFSSGIIKKKDGNYYRYRCETEGCTMQNKGPRAKIVTDFAIDFLDQNRFTTRSNYELYAKDIKEEQSRKSKELASLLMEFGKTLEQKRKDYDNAKRITADGSNPLAKHYAKDLDSMLKEIEDTEDKLEKTQVEKANLKDSILTYEKYLELFDNVAILLRPNKSVDVLDQILSKFFSNFTLEGHLVPPKNAVTRWKVVSYKLKEPYAGFFKTGNFELGRG